MTAAGGLLTTTTTSDLVAMTGWERVEWNSELIAEHEGGDVGRAWLLTNLFRQIAPPMALRVSIANAAADWQPHQRAMSWSALRKMAAERLAGAGWASKVFTFGDVSPQLARNQEVLRHLHSEANRELRALPSGAIQSGNDLARFQTDIAGQQQEAAAPKRRSRKRRNARSVPQTYEDLWRPHGVSSARELLSRDLVANWVDAATTLESADGLPPMLHQAAVEWRSDLTAAAPAART